MLLIQSYFSQVDAALAVTLLEDYGIACALFDEHVNALAYWIAFPARLMVPEPQAQRAARILRYAEAAPVPTDEEAAADDKAAVRTLDEHIFGEDEEFAESAKPLGSNNPWEILAVAYTLLIPGIGFLLEKVPIMFFVGGRRGNRWIRLEPLDVHLIGAALVCLAIVLTISYVAARRAIHNEPLPLVFI